MGEGGIARLYNERSESNKIVGYAMVITDKECKTIFVDEIYCPDHQVQDYISNYPEMFDDICELEDALVLITFNTWSEKYWTDYGWEYDGGVNVENIIVLQSNYKEFKRNQIKDLLKYCDTDEEQVELICEFEDIFDEDFDIETK